ncbi:von Willebrand factor type A domain-containing protein [Thermodesulfobacteriota bacterium]
MAYFSGQEKTQNDFGASGVIMKNDELKKRLNAMPVPDPSKEAREKALHAAMAEFERLEKKDEKNIKGFSWFGRLKAKTFQRGPAMRKQLVYSVGLAFSLILVAIIIWPNFISYRKAASYKTMHKTAPAVKSAPPTLESGQAVKGKMPAADTIASAPVVKYARPPMETDWARQPAAPATGAAGSRKLALRAYSAEKEGRFSQPDQTYVGRDRFRTITANPVKLVRETPVSTFSIDVDTAAYAFVRRALHNGALPQKNAVRIEELINYFNYDYPGPGDRTVPFRATVGVFPTPWNPDTKLLHIGIKGFDIDPLKKPQANLVFLIDVSGSMKSPDKLPLLKNAFRMLVETLDPKDRVAIVVYAGAAGTVLEPTLVKEKGKIMAQLDRLSAGGSTAGGAGIRQAYALAEANFDPAGVNRVILATDGDFNVGIRNPEELKGFVERKRQTGVYLTVLGFGRGNYHDALMQTLAQNGNGIAAYIDTLNEARKVLVDEAHASLFPIAKDVKIQIEFNPAFVAEYRMIGYETRLLRREDFNNDRVDAGDVGAGHSVTAIYEITPAGSKGRRMDDLRYGRPEATTKIPMHANSAEYAFLKIRYKLPDAEESRLLTTPINSESEYQTLAKVPAEARFASAVAAFGQLLRGDPYLERFDYNDVITLAEKARGKDRFGYRAEFLNLVRLAKTARAMEDR